MSSWGDDIAANTGGFIDLVRPGAVATYRKYGILPSLTIAQSIIESNWGKSAPGYNLFGIKWSEGCGYDKQQLWTREYLNEQWVKVQASFRKYTSYEESIEDHARLLLKARYAKVLQTSDYKTACKEIQAAGYATDPGYPQKLISLIEKYGLDQWDREGYKMFNDFDEVADWAKAYVEAVAKAGIMIGDDGGNFRPKDNITREEMAAIVSKLLRK